MSDSLRTTRRRSILCHAKHGAAQHVDERRRAHFLWTAFQTARRRSIPSRKAFPGRARRLTLPSCLYGRPGLSRTEEKVGIPAPAFVLAQKDGGLTEGLNQVTKNSCQRLFQPVFARLDTKLSFKPSRNRRANAPVARAPVAAIDRHPRKYQLTSTMPPGKERTDAPKAWWISDATSPSWLSETWACTLRDASSSLVRMILPGR